MPATATVRLPTGPIYRGRSADAVVGSNAIGCTRLNVVWALTMPPVSVMAVRAAIEPAMARARRNGLRGDIESLAGLEGLLSPYAVSCFFRVIRAIAVPAGRLRTDV
jgi:hypothetical protein